MSAISLSLTNSWLSEVSLFALPISTSETLPSFSLVGFSRDPAMFRDRLSLKNLFSKFPVGSIKFNFIVLPLRLSCTKEMKLGFDSLLKRRTSSSAPSKVSPLTKLSYVDPSAKSLSITSLLNPTITFAVGMLIIF